MEGATDSSIMDCWVREFSVSFSHNGTHLPWFAVGWEHMYLTSNKMDRVIYTTDRLTRLGEETLRALNGACRQRVLVIPFDSESIRGHTCGK